MKINLNKTLQTDRGCLLVGGHGMTKTSNITMLAVLLVCICLEKNEQVQWDKYFSAQQRFVSVCNLYKRRSARTIFYDLLLVILKLICCQKCGSESLVPIPSLFKKLLWSFGCRFCGMHVSTEEDQIISKLPKQTESKAFQLQKHENR